MNMENMDLRTISYILCRKETKIFVICTATGGLLQFFCRRYIKNHPEFFEEPEITLIIKDTSGKTERITNKKAKEPIIRRILKHFCGGGLQEKVGDIVLRVLLKKLIKLAAKKGVEFSISIDVGAIFTVVPKKALVKIIEGSLPQSLLDTKSFSIVNEEKVYLENCSEGFKFMFAILMDNEIPYYEKNALVAYVFGTLLSKTEPLNLILCLVPILFILAMKNPSAYYLAIRNLILAIKEGRISKRIVRVMVRRLLSNGQMVDPELLDIIEE